MGLNKWEWGFGGNNDKVKNDIHSISGKFYSETFLFVHSRLQFHEMDGMNVLVEINHH